MPSASFVVSELTEANWHLSESSI